MSARIYINDDMLSAYLDNELPEPQRAAVEQALTQNAALAQRLETLRQTDALIHEQARIMDSRPLPEGIRRLLESAETANEPGAAGRFSQWLRDRLSPAPNAWALGLATLALAVAAIPLFNMMTSDPYQSSIATYTHLLDTTPSGQTVAVGEQGQLTHRFSFQAADGRYCRQFQLLSSGRMEENIACRNEDGWALEASFMTAAAPAGIECRPASGSALLDDALDVLVVGETLTLAEEEALIARRWSH